MKHRPQPFYPLRNELLAAAVSSEEQFREGPISEVELHALPERRIYLASVVRQYTFGELSSMPMVQPYKIQRGITDCCIAPINHTCQYAVFWVTQYMFASKTTVNQHGLESENVSVIKK